MYAYMVRSGETHSTALPCEHFDRKAGKWLVPETPPNWEEVQAEEEVPAWAPAFGYAPYEAGPSD